MLVAFVLYFAVILSISVRNVPEFFCRAVDPAMDTCSAQAYFLDT
jgi:hypothetical protein